MAVEDGSGLFPLVVRPYRRRFRCSGCGLLVLCHPVMIGRGEDELDLRYCDACVASVAGVVEPVLPAVWPFPAFQVAVVWEAARVLLARGEVLSAERLTRALRPKGVSVAEILAALAKAGLLFVQDDPLSGPVYALTLEEDPEPGQL